MDTLLTVIPTLSPQSTNPSLSAHFWYILAQVLMTVRYKVNNTLGSNSVKLTGGDQQRDSGHVEPVGGAVGAGIPANSWLEMS